MFDRIYQNVSQAEPLFWIVLGLVFCLGVVLRMIYETVADGIVDRLEERRERRAEGDATRIMEGLHPEFEPSIDNEVYHTGNQRTLSDRWRDFVDEAAPRSPEIVAEAIYREATYAFSPIRAEVSRNWPTWTEEQMRIPGRHRRDPNWDMDALNTPTGSFKAVTRKELVSV